MADAIDSLRQLLDDLAALLRLLGAGHSQFTGLTCFLSGLLDVAGDLIDRRGHLVHRRGGLVSFIALGLQGTFGLLVEAAVFLGQGGGLVGEISQAAKRRANPCILADQCQVQQRQWPGGIAVGAGHQRAVECFWRYCTSPAEQLAGVVQAGKTLQPKQDQGQQQRRAGQFQAPERRAAHYTEQRQHEEACQLRECLATADGRAPLVQARVERFGTAHLLAVGFAAHRLVADDPAVFLDGRDIGADPIVIAVLAAVLDDAHPAASGF